MKTKFILLSFLLMAITNAYAQNSNLEVRLQKIVDSANWEFTVQLDFTDNPGSGIFIELPSTIKAVPIAITLNDQNLWLKQSTEAASSDTAIHWETTETGLILQFNSGIINPSDKINVKCMAQVSKRASSDKLVSIKKIIDSSNFDGELIASQDLNLTQ